MTRYLQFGCGQNILPSPWENYDSELDIRKVLPFQVGASQYILAEHVIEHIEFRQGVFFLGECLRILQIGGVLRLAFPDITREISVENYCPFFTPHYSRQMNCSQDVWLSILIDWEHKACWTRDMGKRVLLAVGFESVEDRDYGCSPHPELMGIDGHHLGVGLTLARAETTILEATR